MLNSTCCTVEHVSNHNNLDYNNYSLQGAPQDSILGPLLLSLHLPPLSQIKIEQHSFNFYNYTDNKQFYISFAPNDSNRLTSVNRIS